MEASPSTATVSIAYPNTQIVAEWAFVHCANTKTTGTNGADAIVQAVTGTSGGVSSSNPTITMSAFGSGSNANLTGWAVGQNVTMTEEGGYTELHESPSYLDSWFKDEIEFKATSDATPSITFSLSVRWDGIALELATP